MRWTIPTLMQQLVDQGVSIKNAEDIVRVTYPATHGDTFHSQRDDEHPEHGSVGVYNIWNPLRGDQSPLGGTKVSDDARTIAQFGRLNGWRLLDIVRFSGVEDYAINRVASATAAAMRAGDYFEPVRIEEENLMPERLRDMRRTVAQMDGAADYITSIPLPHFGS